MDEETKDVKDVDVNTTTEDRTEETKTNRGWKEDPKTLRLINEIKTLKAETEATKEIAAKEANEKALKEAEEKNDYEKALEIQKAEKIELEKQFSKYKLQNEITLEVMALNAPKEVADLALAQYQQLSDDDKPEISEFVKTFSEHPVYSAMFGAGQVSATQTPPGTMTVGGTSAMNAKKADAMTKSDDPKERAAGRDFLTNYFREHGKLPD